MPVSMPLMASLSSLWTPTITSTPKRWGVLQAMESADAEVAVFGGVCEPSDAAPKRVQQLMSPKAWYLRRPHPRLLFHANAQPYACRVAFSRELLNREGIRFAPGLALGEDVVFHLAYALARKTVVMPDKFYHYVMESDSATHEFNSDEARAKKLDAHMRMLEMVLRTGRPTVFWTCAPASRSPVLGPHRVRLGTSGCRWLLPCCRPRQQGFHDVFGNGVGGCTC